MGIEEEFNRRCGFPSDINEHLTTLCVYAKHCNHVTECGVRTCVSTYAFANALKANPSAKLVQVDLDWHGNIDAFQELAKKEGLATVFHKDSSLTCPMEPTDLLFIDTWHVYAQLKRELERWHSHVGKYIIMHDTTVDADYGETLRMQLNAEEQSRTTGFPLDEIRRGLWPAVIEFIATHPEWSIEHRFTHNNGLTILVRN